MNDTLHITNGDSAGKSLSISGISGDVLIWRDILYDGPRNPGWPDDSMLEARAEFLSQTTAGGIDKARVLTTLKNQYQKLEAAGGYDQIILWFDACLCDQSMLVHILTCMYEKGIRKSKLICVDSFPGIEPFNGLGQLQPNQLASQFDRRCPVTEAQFQFSKVVDKAFATQDPALLADLSHRIDAPLPWIPAAVKRWILEQPDPITGLGRLESLALEAIREGCESPSDIFTAVAVADTPPQFWGDTTLWAKINGLADRKPPLVKIVGPAKRLPQWENTIDLRQFRITSLPGNHRQDIS